MINIDDLTRRYFSLDKSVPYKLKCGEIVNIHPITVEEWGLFEICYDVLTFDKNSIDDIHIIQMSYLQFLLDIIFQQDDNCKNKLVNILAMCLKIDSDKVVFGKVDGKCVIGIDYILDEFGNCIKNGFNITPKDFDEIKSIILHQNICGYDDTKISEDIRKIMEDYYRLSNGNLEPVTLEDKLTFVGIECGMKKNEMFSMTYRDFSKRFSMLNEKLEYMINKPLETSGTVKFKSKIEGLFAKTKKNKFSQFFVDSDSVKNTIEGANG